MADLGASVVRTVVPALAGAVIAWAAQVGLNLDEGAVTSIVTVLAVAAYYAVARWIETKVSPKFGRILLSLGLVKSAPTYTDQTI